MKLHELISPIDKHMDTEYGTKSPAKKFSYNNVNSRDLTPKDDILSPDNNTSNNMTSDFTQKDALNVLRSVVKKFRGKEPIIKTDGGTEVSVDPFGGEKSIKVNRKF
jgi:hypothetical protein